MSLQTKYSRWLEIIEINQKVRKSEENSFFIIKAQNKQLMLTIDGGIIPKGIQNQKRCDYAFYDENNKRSNFIELKGIDSEEACKQIYATILYFQGDEDLRDIVTGMNRLKGFIVSPHPKVPYIADMHMKKLCRKLYNKSRDKHDDPSHHLVFARCLHNNKNPAKITRQDATHIIISDKNPLLL